MAGGTSIWFSQDAKTDPKEIFNGRLLYLLITVAWAGCFYGFDSGNIGGILTLPSFERAFGLDGLTTAELDNRKVSISRSCSCLRASSDLQAIGHYCSHAGSRCKPSLVLTLHPYYPSS